MSDPVALIGWTPKSAANGFEPWTYPALDRLRKKLLAELALQLRGSNRVALSHPRQHSVDLYAPGVVPRLSDRCESSWSFSRTRGTRIRLKVEDAPRGLVFVEAHPCGEDGEPRRFSCLAALLGKGSWRGAPLGMRRLGGETRERWIARFAEPAPASLEMGADA